MDNARRLGWVVALPTTLFVLAFALFPVVVLAANSLGLGKTGLRESAGFSFDHYAKVLASPGVQQSIVNSLVVSVLSVLLAMAVAVPVVLELARRTRDGVDTGGVDAVVMLPIALPGTVIGFFAIVLIGNTGLLAKVFPALEGASYTIPGVLVAYIYFTLPRAIGPLRGAAQALDPAETDTARSLGASRWYVFRTITFPQLLPAIVESSGTALAIALGGYGTIATLSQGVRMLPLDVVDQLSSAGYNIAAASATAIVLGVLSVAFLLLGHLGSRFLLQRAGLRGQKGTTA
ncbi:MAG: ABC transporter permease subunit [Propionibacteriaceae bacterium]|nr:ABC transporter permease subunit [Propionibacteriaceae bacterium]